MSKTNWVPSRYLARQDSPEQPVSSFPLRHPNHIQNRPDFRPADSTYQGSLTQPDELRDFRVTFFQRQRPQPRVDQGLRHPRLTPPGLKNEPSQMAVKKPSLFPRKSLPIMPGQRAQRTQLKPRRPKTAGWRSSRGNPALQEDSTQKRAKSRKARPREGLEAEGSSWLTLSF